MQPLFSIIIPVYNVEQYLRDCLDSVFQQTYANFEVICVNDGSTDSSLAILQEYKLKYPELIIVNQENNGLGGARNTGLKKAKGDYVFFLDSDDWLEKDALKILADTTKNDEDIICFNGKMFFEENGEEKADEGVEEEVMTGWEYYNKYALVPRNFHFVCVVLRLYKRTFLLENNIFFEEGIYHEDNLFTPIACYYAQKVRAIPDTLYVYRIREGSITTNIKLKNLIDTIKIANSLSDFFISKQNIDKSVLYREIAGEYFSVFISPKSDVYDNKYAIFKPLINWENYKTVSVYRRHKIIYNLLRINPLLFRAYLVIEERLKKLLAA